MLLKNIDKEIVNNNRQPLSKVTFSVHEVKEIVTSIASKQKDVNDVLHEIEKIEEKTEKLTIKDFLERALVFNNDKEKERNSDYVLKRYKSWKKFDSCKNEIDLTIDEIKDIKDNLAKMTNNGLSIVIAGQVISFLEDTK